MKTVYARYARCNRHHQSARPTSCIWRRREETHTVSPHTATATAEPLHCIASSIAGVKEEGDIERFGDKAREETAYHGFLTTATPQAGGQPDTS